MDKFRLSSQALLQRLGDVLGIPIEHFFAANSHNGALAEPADTAECLRLWSKIQTAEGRRQALEALQLIARTEGR